MIGFKFGLALASALAMTSVHYGSADVATSSSFQATFKGVDRDGRSLLWSSDEKAHNFVIHVLPLGSEMSAAESVWPVSATIVMRDGAGAPMEAKLYGIIDWTKSALLLHGDCDSGAAAGSSVSASAKFTNLELAGAVEVLPVTASR
ncbi:MAG TPA: hypothetical protein VN717_06060 [Gemmatimonadaceae bacterium]|nr:hypothetical protein [Gemmatimonadaceae bacterium]